MTIPTLALAALSLLALPAARLGADPTRADAPAPHLPAPQLTGRVVYEGTPPLAKVLPGTSEQTKGCCPDGGPVDLKDPTLVIDAKGHIANVVVTIEVEGVRAEPAKEPLVVDQKRCVFEPHVAVLHAGSKVRFLNSDTVTHNVRASSLKNDSFNWVMTPGGKEEVVFQKPDRVTIGCDYHPWMSMIVFVTDTPYHAVTAQDGTFSISGLKPGSYKAKLWHEKLGRAEAEVVVRPDGTSEPLLIKMAEKKKKT
ncbi:MAG: hypothetical protein JNK02_06355 [Planctomycetes bacterium]|nr:hypothetical protein [Planctomycetota bacterium]